MNQDSEELKMFFQVQQQETQRGVSQNQTKQANRKETPQIKYSNFYSPRPKLAGQKELKQNEKLIDNNIPKTPSGIKPQKRNLEHQSKTNQLQTENASKDIQSSNFQNIQKYRIKSHDLLNQKQQLQQNQNQKIQQQQEQEIRSLSKQQELQDKGQQSYSIITQNQKNQKLISKKQLQANQTTKKEKQKQDQNQGQKEIQTQQKKNSEKILQQSNSSLELEEKVNQQLKIVFPKSQPTKIQIEVDDLVKERNKKMLTPSKKNVNDIQEKLSSKQKKDKNCQDLYKYAICSPSDEYYQNSYQDQNTLASTLPNTTRTQQASKSTLKSFTVQKSNEQCSLLFSTKNTDNDDTNAINSIDSSNPFQFIDEKCCKISMLDRDLYNRHKIRCYGCFQEQEEQQKLGKEQLDKMVNRLYSGKNKVQKVQKQMEQAYSPKINRNWKKYYINHIQNTNPIHKRNLSLEKLPKRNFSQTQLKEDKGIQTLNFDSKQKGQHNESTQTILIMNHPQSAKQLIQKKLNDCSYYLQNVEAKQQEEEKYKEYKKDTLDQFIMDKFRTIYNPFQLERKKGSFN